MNCLYKLEWGGRKVGRGSIQRIEDQISHLLVEGGLEKALRSAAAAFARPKASPDDAVAGARWREAASKRRSLIGDPIGPLTLPQRYILLTLWNFHLDAPHVAQLSRVLSMVETFLTVLTGRSAVAKTLFYRLPIVSNLNEKNQCTTIRTLVKKSPQGQIRIAKNSHRFHEMLYRRLAG